MGYLVYLLNARQSKAEKEEIFRFGDAAAVHVDILLEVSKRNKDIWSGVNVKPG